MRPRFSPYDLTRGRGALAAVPALLALFCAVAGSSGPKDRIASLNLASDEILEAIVDKDRLVAVTAVGDEPETSNVAGRLPAGAVRFRRADLERLLTLSPSLVIVSEYTDADFLGLLVRSGLRYHRMDGLTSFSGVRRAILDLGAAVGEPDGARVVVERYDATLEDLARRLKGAERPRVLYWTDPMTAGGGTMISEIIEAAGARNIGKEMGIQGILPVGTERVFASAPDFIVVGAAPEARVGLERDPLLSSLRAVKAGKIIQMPNRLLVTLSQYTADAAWYLAARLHPERVPEAKR